MRRIFGFTELTHFMSGFFVFSDYLHVNKEFIMNLNIFNKNLKYRNKLSHLIRKYNKEIDRLQDIQYFPGSLHLSIGIFTLTCISALSPFQLIQEPMFLIFTTCILAMFLFTPVVISRKIISLQYKVRRLQARLDRLFI